MRYAEYSPSPRLAPFVRCYWVLEDLTATAAHEPERILPDGCVELVVHYGEPMRRVARDGTAHRQRRSVIAGQMTRYVTLQPTGRMGMFGVRFEPAGARPLLGARLDGLTGCVESLDAVWGQPAGEFEERLLEAADDRGRVAVAERLLSRRLNGHERPAVDVDRAVRGVIASGGNAPVESLARAADLSRRQLERRFLADVGLSPKALSRVVRFQEVFRRLETEPSMRWVDVAIDCGYADQSHLVRDFREFAGRSPARYLSDDHPIADCFTA